MLTIESYLSHLLLPNTICPAFNEKLPGIHKSKKKTQCDDNKAKSALKYIQKLH